MAYQLVLRAPNCERTVGLDRVIVVGREPECDVPMDSVRLSRRHAEFTPTPQGVSVRDLGSRNGVMVNGMRVEEALIGPADRVLLGDVAVTVTQSAGAGLGPPAAPGPYPLTQAPSPGFAAPPAPAPSWQPQGQGWAPAPQAGGQQDKTSVLPRGAAPVAAPAPATRSRTSGKSLTSKLGSRLGVGGRTMAGALAAALLMFAATAVPLVLARSDVVQRETTARASTIVRALGAENGPALASGQTLAVGIQSAMLEPGVKEALILSPQGRVLAPAERMDETLTRLGAFGDLASLQGLQTVSVNNEIEAAAVVESGGRQLGIVWVKLDPSYANAGSPVLLYLLASLAVGLAAAAGVGFFLRRMFTAGLTTFATDVDLAASGQLDVVTEPFGMPRLAESVNFIIGRLRLAPQQVIQAPAPQTYAAAAPPRPAVEREGRLVLDSAFIVKEASTGAAQILHTTVDRLQEHHVLEAIGEQALVNAIIDAVGNLSSQDSATRQVASSGGEPGLELQAQRSTPDGPIQVTIRRLG